MVTVETSNNNIGGLRSMQQTGIQLNTFTEDSWQTIITATNNNIIIHECNRQILDRKKEDKLLEADLRHILGNQ